MSACTLILTTSPENPPPCMSTAPIKNHSTAKVNADRLLHATGTRRSAAGQSGHHKGTERR